MPGSCKTREGFACAGYAVFTNFMAAEFMQ
jgi:hypothetical protein